MKDAQGHGSDPRGVSGGNVSPQDAARAMHSDHVVQGVHDSTYHGPHSHAAYAAEGIGDLVHRTVNTSAPQRAGRIERARAQLRAKMGPLLGR